MKVRRLVMCALMAALMSVGSIIRIPLPFTPVPVTLQVASCLIAGALLGGADGALSMIVYVLLGAFGLPVFSGMNAGVGYLVGPTGGFILGFIPYAYLTGKLTRRLYNQNSNRFVKFTGIFVSMSFATIVFYLCGVAYFSLSSGSGFVKAIALSVLPFIWLDLFKIILAAIAVTQLYQYMAINDPA